MTEWHPENDDNDDTERLPDAASTRHRYDEGATPFGQPAQPPYREPDPAHFGGLGFHDQPTRPEPPRRTGRPGSAVIAGILAGALVVGGVAGLAGAAGFTLVDNLAGNDTTTTSAAPATSSSVVNRKDAAPDADSVEQVARRCCPRWSRSTSRTPRSRAPGRAS